MNSAQFATVLAVLERIASALEQGVPRAPARVTEADVELVRCIAAVCGPKQFSAWEVIEHARLPASQGLRAAILESIGVENSRRLGMRLRRLEGEDVCGLRVVRVGSTREGADWAIRATRE